MIRIHFTGLQLTFAQLETIEFKDKYEAVVEEMFFYFISFTL